jgi:hypothetical protein
MQPAKRVGSLGGRHPGILPRPRRTAAGEFAHDPAGVEGCLKGGAHMGILWIVLIVILVLALLGYLGRGRLS